MRVLPAGTLLQTESFRSVAHLLSDRCRMFPNACVLLYLPDKTQFGKLCLTSPRGPG